MTELNKQQLRDIGEFRLLNERILPLLREDNDLIGDDCAFVPIPSESEYLVVTTDAGPKPLYYSVECPYYHIWGWYTVLANVSDLASAGCTPLALSLAVEAMPEMAVEDLMDYFQGVKAASLAFGIPISGGNIKANRQFISNATAIGTLEKGRDPLTRRSCKDGDVAVSIGDNGLFIVAYLKYLEGRSVDWTESERTKISGPYPQLRQMQTLSNRLTITAASDNSDGILGSLWNIAEKSGVGFTLDFDKITLPSHINRYVESGNISPWNLFLFWGDWQVIITIPPSQLDLLELTCQQSDIEYCILGTATKTHFGLKGILDGNLRPLTLLRNENFTNLSYNQNIQSHLDYLLKTDIFTNE